MTYKEKFVELEDEIYKLRRGAISFINKNHHKVSDWSNLKLLLVNDDGINKYFRPKTVVKSTKVESKLFDKVLNKSSETIKSMEDFMFIDEDEFFVEINDVEYCIDNTEAIVTVATYIENNIT